MCTYDSIALRLPLKLMALHKIVDNAELMALHMELSMQKLHQVSFTRIAVLICSSLLSIQILACQ